MLLENAHYHIEIEETRGIILGIRDKVGGYDLISEPRLAENYRLLLPLPQMQSNYILGKDQRLSSLDALDDGVRLRWDGPLTNAQGCFDLSVTLWIEFVGETIQFRCEVENRTDFALAEVWYPVIGGMAGLGEGEAAKRTGVLVPHGYSQWVRDLFRTFGAGECLGVDGGEHAFNYPGNMSMPWTSLYHPDLRRGALFMVKDTEPRCKLLRFGLVPGTAHQRVDGDWPALDETGDTPIGVIMSWTMLPYTPPGARYIGPPVVLQCHAGGWKDAARLYRSWFERAFGVVDARGSWIREKTTSLDTMFMLPEDNVSLTFADIPAWARTAKKHGVTAVLISGWQVGGHDRGYPRYTPEPRLGSWDDLEAGIHACHALGVRVYFFVNVQPADMTTTWYREELHRYRVLDPWGSGYGHCGFGMGTLSARMGLTDVGMEQLSPAFPRVREIFVEQMRKLAQIGADGVHIDKFLCPGLDFNPLLEMAPDQADWWGMLQTVEEMLAACRAINPEFAFSYEGWFDRLMSYSDIVWWAPSEHSVMKIAFPEWTPHVSVTQPYAFNTVNLAVLRAQHLLAGPRNYQAGMDYAPMQALNRYIGEITRIRESMVPLLAAGALVDASDPLFAADPPLLQVAGSFAASPHGQWSVFRDAYTGCRAVVLANLGRSPLDAEGITLADGAERCRVYQAFTAPIETSMPAALTVPAERVVILVES